MGEYNKTFDFVQKNKMAADGKIWTWHLQSIWKWAKLTLKKNDGRRWFGSTIISQSWTVQSLFKSLKWGAISEFLTVHLILVRQHPNTIPALLLLPARSSVSTRNENTSLSLLPYISQRVTFRVPTIFIPISFLPCRYFPIDPSLLLRAKMVC